MGNCSDPEIANSHKTSVLDVERQSACVGSKHQRERETHDGGILDSISQKNVILVTIRWG